jgi:hypothetical protein
MYVKVSGAIDTAESKFHTVSNNAESFLTPWSHCWHTWSHCWHTWSYCWLCRVAVYTRGVTVDTRGVTVDTKESLLTRGVTVGTRGVTVDTMESLLARGVTVDTRGVTVDTMESLPARGVTVDTRGITVDTVFFTKSSLVHWSLFDILASFLTPCSPFLIPCRHSWHRGVIDTLCAKFTIFVIVLFLCRDSHSELDLSASKT